MSTSLTAHATLDAHEGVSGASETRLRDLRAGPTHESHGRSFAKALSWRVLGTTSTSVIVFVTTRRWGLSLFVGAMEFVSKIGAYWAHERIWDRVRYGRARTSA